MSCRHPQKPQTCLSKSFTCNFFPSIPLLGRTHSFVSSHEGVPLWDCWSSESSCWSSHSYRSYSSALSPVDLSSCPTGSARLVFLLPQPDSLARPTVNNRETALAGNSQILCLRNGHWVLYVRQSKMPWREGFPKLPRRSPFVLKHSYCS